MLLAGEVVEEDAGQTSCLLTVRDDKVRVRPRLKLRIPSLIETIAHFPVCSMEMLHVLHIEVTGCNVCASAKPPRTEFCFKVSVVEVHGGAMWVLRVHHPM